MSHSRAENECRTRRFRFAEQVRSVVAALEAYGQPIEVHLPFYTDSAYDALPTTTLPEFPVYRAPVPVELIEAFWTPNYSEPVEHNLRINLRPGGVAAAVRLQEIASASVMETLKGRRVLPGQVLTLEISTDGAPAKQTPIGLLSLYLRGAT